MKVFKNKKAGQSVLNLYDNFLEKWGVDFYETDILGEFGTTHCVECGNSANPPLILFHGVGDNSAIMWLLNIASLAERFHCIAVDTLGGPGKSKPGGAYAKEFDQLGWIDSILNHYSLEKTNMAGVSNGAYMAYNYAVNRKTRINRIVCIEGGFILDPLKTMMQTIGLMFPEVLLPVQSNMMKIFYKLCSPESKVFIENRDIVEYMVLVMKSHYQSAMFRHGVNKYIPGEADAIKDSMLFLYGDYLIEKKAELLKVLEEGGFRYAVIQDAGHALNMEQYEKVNEMITGFLIHG